MGGEVVSKASGEDLLVNEFCLKNSLALVKES